MKVYKTLENGIKIIEYEERYAASIADMWNRSRDNWGGGSDLETEQSQLDFYRNGSYYNVYLALAGEEVIGLCSLSRYYKDMDATYLHVLNVRPDYMSKKVGKAMVLLSLERTIELGYPRLEIHTWPGNTQAVPLYKKCGFMWEDNPETTHLTNYLPTILSQELLKPYFAEADWYADSTRLADIKPDGVKKDGFEYFTYTWARKDGKNLAVTIEKFGRRISRVETDEYLLELTAENHLLAYGFDYSAQVKSAGKNALPLNVDVNGRDDGVISFSPEKSKFSVGKPSKKQDPFSKHPCVLAELTVNGLAIELGAGIEVKPPLTAFYNAETGLIAHGSRHNAYITLESALLTEAKISFSLPDSEHIRFDKTQHTADIGASGKACIELAAEALKPGHAQLEVPCAITLPDGRQKAVSMPLDVVNQSLTGFFPCMTETSYGIVNGPFRLDTCKTSNNTKIINALADNLHPDEEHLLFTASKLGKPYQDEFNLAVPVETKAYQSGAEMVMELSYASEKQPGIVMTMIYTLSAAGVVTRRHRVSNTGGEDRCLFLNETIFTHISPLTAYCYDGRITLSKDASDDGVGSIDAKLFEENWVFEDSPGCTIGVCWDINLKPSFRFDDGLVLEHELSVASGAAAETPPVTICIGVFRDFSAFRSYALQRYSPYIEPTEDLLEVIINNGNPFVSSDDFKVCVRNNRSRTYSGSIEISSEYEQFIQPQASECRDCDSMDSLLASFTFRPEKQKVYGKVGIIKTRAAFPALLTGRTRAVFFPSGNTESVDKDGILSVSNGCMTFKSDPGYFPGLYSLKTGLDTEWLLSRHPKLEPYGWWSPFVGGMRNWLEKIDAANTLKENISASFAERMDNFGNLWQGVSARAEITLCKEYKGLTCESYYLALPGVPVLCSFTRFINNTGGYLSTSADEGLYYKSGKQGGMESIAEVTHKGKTTHVIPGNGNSAFSTHKADFVRITAENGEKLHWLPNFADRRAWGTVHNDIHCFSCFRDFVISLKNSSELLTRPMFLVFSGNNISPDELAALERIIF